MSGAGHVVRDQRGQQAVNGAEGGENECGLEDDPGNIHLKSRHHEGWQPCGNVAQNRRTGDKAADHGANDQCGQRAGHDSPPARWPLEHHHQGERADDERGPDGVRYRARNLENGGNRATSLGFMAEQSRQLQGDDDAADATHEPGNHWIGHQPYVVSKAQHPEGDLDQSRENHGGEDQPHIAGQRGEDPREHDDHRPGGASDL